MNQVVKGKWVAALRSGEYRQGRNVLRTFNDEFCCLGVLCDLHSKETGTSWKDEGDGRRYHYLDDPCCMPQAVAEWAGLKNTNPGKASDSGTVIWTAISANDDKMLSFTEIADLIERDL